VYSRHGQALLGTERYNAPAPLSPDLTAFYNSAPWLAVPFPFDSPTYLVSNAADGVLTALATTPATAGTLPLAGFPGGPLPTESAGIISPASSVTVPTTYIYETADGSLATGTYILDREKYWGLEVRTSTGALVADVTKHWGGKATFNADQPPQLEFNTVTEVFGNVAVDAPFGLFALAAQYEIWLRDWRGFLMGRFEITSAKFVDNPPAEYLEIKAQGLVARLSRESVATFTTPVVKKTNPDGSLSDVKSAQSVSQIVTRLLALQLREPAIEVGFIDPAIGTELRYFAVKDTTILAALQALQNTLPKALAGTITVDADYKLQWLVNVGYANLTLSKTAPEPALRAVNVSARFDEMITRLYLYGQGQSTDTFLSIAPPTAYMDRNSDTFGIISARKTDNRIIFQETLRNVASRILDETASPYFQVEVDVLDLVKADQGYTMPDVWPGATYALDSPAALAMGGASVKVQSVTYDLANPLPLDVKLEARAERLSDIFDRILGQLNPTIPLDKLLATLKDDSTFENFLADEVADALDAFDAFDVPTPAAERLQDSLNEAIDRYEPMPDTHPGETLPEAVQDHEDRLDAVEDILGGEPETPLPVNPEENVAGDSEKMARADHEHLGMPQPAIVTALPAIPETGCLMVLWTSDDGGTGDNQVWMAYAGQAKWYPMQFFTSKSGAVV
jgi:hypothetical protein